MENKRRRKTFAEFISGKGFYIVLFLCVAAIGISGYILLFPGKSETVNEAEKGSIADRIESAAEQTPISVEEPVLDPDAVEDVIGEAQVVIPEDVAETPQPKSQESSPPAQDNETMEQVTGDIVSGVIIWPLSGSVDKSYSKDELLYSNTFGDWRTHKGLDISANIGDEVLAISSGVVSAVYEDVFMGCTVVIDHRNGMQSMYSNLAEEQPVAEGYAVSAGDVIGYVGASAISEYEDSPHLHFELSVDGANVDPMGYLPSQPE